ncbi:protein AGENET DOMAIN (AGD)-CONTAINING P1 [Coffea arabica]|uniref:Protein AGENET DOMAIN (AGD)-CONTAINING P1 n=1 Tax=Coffea arabica TaxID=13443 RepID=A0A6P6W5H9_COFAR|nr:DUF724 domain-containing protein 3-like [Coffea arabica]
MDYFIKGAEVEISSDEDGFRGSWFAGTVIRKLKNDKILVEYKTLMQDDLRKIPLREEIDVVQLRPPAPRETHREFKVSEEVDVYFNDGWWEGVITGVSKTGKFAVFFRSSRELSKFHPSKLRLHREWVNGTWVPPLEIEPKEDKKVSILPAKRKPGKETVQEKFSRGATVEVRIDEDGFQGAWIPATVIKRFDEDKYLIQYRSLRNEEDTEFLKEEVASINIRPHPPETALVDCFKVNDKVDALFNDCWWEGVISRVLREKKYIIYFPGTEDAVKFKHSDLRQHQEWIDGKWAIPS